MLDSEIPQEMLAGCKTPMPLIMRAAVAAVGCIAVYLLVEYAVKRALVKMPLDAQTVTTVQFVAACGAVYLAYRPMWTFLKENLRECSTYKMFKRFYREELGQKGMTKQMAIGDALEKVEIHKQYQRQRRQKDSGAPRVGISF